MTLFLKFRVLKKSHKRAFKSRSLKLKKPNKIIRSHGEKTRRATETTEKVEDEEEDDDNDGQTARS